MYKRQIIISRYFLIAIGSLALIGALFALIYSLTLIGDSPNTSKGRLPSITYDESFKSKLFPKPKAPVTQFKAPQNLRSATPSNNQNPVDKRFVDLRTAISKQFDDSQANLNRLYQNITPRTLEAFFKSNYSYMGDDYDDLVSGLIDFFDDIKNINDFKRVGNFDDRLDLVGDALEMYIDDFQDNISARQDNIQSLSLIHI